MCANRYQAAVGDGQTKAKDVILDGKPKEIHDTHLKTNEYL